MTVRLLALLFATLLALPAAAQQRDAAFIQPNGGSAKHDSDEVISPTPKQTDLGPTIIGITKRVTLYFTNYSGRDATIASISINADSNIRTEAVQNDCTTLGKLKANDKCSVIIEITPNSPGKWTAEIVAVHDAAGRISRATITGETAGDSSANGQQPGLSLVGAAKDQQIDFGDVAIGSHAARSVLLANDSAGPLTIEKIALVAPDKGLALTEQGCREGDVVPAGSSCPVTVLWAPGGSTDISTDLIIRHTGPVGFAVIPVRGKSGGGAPAGPAVTDTKQQTAAASLPTAGTAIPAIPAADLFARAAGEKSPLPRGGNAGAGAKDIDLSSSAMMLRGMAGEQAILSDAAGQVSVVAVGQDFTSDGVTYQLASISANSATLTSGKHTTVLSLQKAVPIYYTDESATGTGTKKDGGTTKTTASKGKGSSSGGGASSMFGSGSSSFGGLKGNNSETGNGTTGSMSNNNSGSGSRSGSSLF